jgi:hypothetical protein
LELPEPPFSGIRLSPRAWHCTTLGSQSNRTTSIMMLAASCSMSSREALRAWANLWHRIMEALAGGHALKECAPGVSSAGHSWATPWAAATTFLASMLLETLDQALATIQIAHATRVQGCGLQATLLEVAPAGRLAGIILLGEIYRGRVPPDRRDERRRVIRSIGLRRVQI